METITSIITFLNENAGAILGLFVAVLAVAKIVTKFTATPTDDEIVTKVENVGGKIVITLEKLTNKDFNSDGKIG